MKITPNHATVLMLTILGMVRRDIAKEVGIGQGSVTRILEDWRTLLPSGLLNHLQQIGKTVAKARKGEPPAELDVMATAYRLAHTCKQTGIKLELNGDLVSSLKECHAQGVKWPSFAASIKPMIEESIRQGRPVQDITDDANEILKQSQAVQTKLESMNKELAEKETRITKIDRLEAIELKLAKRGILLPEDPDRAVNCLATVVENNSDPHAIIKELGMTRSIKAETIRAAGELKTILEQKEKEQSDLEKFNKEHRNDRDAIALLKDLRSRRLDEGHLLAIHEVVDACKVEDPKKLVLGIRRAGGLVQYIDVLAGTYTKILDLAKLGVEAYNKILSDCDHAYRGAEDSKRKAEYYIRQVAVARNALYDPMLGTGIISFADSDAVSPQPIESRPQPFFDIINGKVRAVGTGT